jgi:hypothetical protein
MAPQPPDVDALLGSYPPRSVPADLQRIGERVAEYIRELLPVLLHVLAAPGGHARLLKLHQKLAFHPLLTAVTQRFERLRNDGLVADLDPSASAHAFLATAHAAALAELLGHSGKRRSTQQLDALLQVLWRGLAPASHDRTEVKPRS